MRGISARKRISPAADRRAEGAHAMIVQLDHLVIAVADLAQAMADYTRLGFTVVAGGEHPGGATHNALVAFADGTYLELLAFLAPNPAHRWWGRGLGLIDFALLPDDTAAVVAAAKAQGLALIGPNTGGRVRPDGVRLIWQTALAPMPGLPFLCGDVTPRSLRLPDPASWHHANGARGIARLTVAVADLAVAAAHYHALLGSPPRPTASGVAFRLAGATIALTPAAGAAGPVAAHIRATSPGALDRQLAHGAALELVI
jgi:catechol 2,3-dioxygenase-like lactoylglutathione lyase family enzyme